MTKNKKRKGEILFLDAREMGFMQTQVMKNFTKEEIEKLGETYQNWANGSNDYQDEKGYCKSASLDEVKAQDYILTPGRYVGVKEAEDDGIPFDEKMASLTADLKTQFAESDRLQNEIKTQLAKVGVNFDAPN